MPAVATVTVSGSLLDVSAGADSYTLSGFSTTLTQNNGSFPASYSVDSMGSLDSSQFDGEVSYVTTMPFTGTQGQYPSTGELEITGRDDAMIRVIAMDSINVRLELDLDGDGAAEQTIDTTWAELAG